MSSIGTKIRKLRELRNYKQGYMADKLGISPGAYGKIERDETELSHERLEQIAKVLDLSVADILSFDEKTVFNFINSQNPTGNSTNNNPVYNYYMSENERKLYEDKIKLLEDKIKYLEEGKWKIKNVIIDFLVRV